jgi:hypothetical protein
LSILNNYLEIACADANATQLRINEVLSMVMSYTTEDWPPVAYWAQQLPEWFTKHFSQPLTMAEADTFVSLPFEERMLAFAKAGWSLDDWLYWMHPSMRSWHGVKTRVLSTNRVAISIDIESDPSPTAALELLFKHSV